MNFAGKKIDFVIVTTGRRFFFITIVMARLLKEMEIEEDIYKSRVLNNIHPSCLGKTRGCLSNELRLTRTRMGLSDPRSLV